MDRLPAEARLAYRRGVIAWKAHQEPQAVSLLRGSANLDPSFVAPHLTLGWWFLTREPSQALLSWAFGHPEVTRVTAETFPDLTPSIRVLKKTGFVLIGKGSEERTIRFELPRTAYERR